MVLLMEDIRLTTWDGAKTRTVNNGITTNLNWCKIQTFLVGGWTKYARQNGNLPQVGVKINNI